MDTIGSFTFTLPGYQAQPDESGVDHSTHKLEEARQALQSHLPLHFDIESHPCQSETDSWAYRCNCTFQLLQEVKNDKNAAEVFLSFHYAMRHQGCPIRLGIGAFPIATRRIQKAMQDLLNILNDPSTPSVITRGLTSVTFSSSWNDIPSADCIVTLLYGEPVLVDEWTKEATRVCQVLCLRQLNGRSKKSFFTANTNNSNNDDDNGNDEKIASTLRDSIFIDSTTWKVHLQEPQQQQYHTPANDHIPMIEVKYEKPETAFFHPNAWAMKDALSWMLHRLDYIRSEQVGASVGSNLLEMYCGCGAHTVALGKSGLVQEILAIELDHRLIEACVYNVALNDLQSIVQVCQGDAGTWARRFYKKSSQNYNILLVDPPRAGLDQDVCDMAKKGNFTHFLYISCGHKALLRDLQRLADTFEVIHCRQLDLFPRTDSIETLVHMRRK